MNDNHDDDLPLYTTGPIDVPPNASLPRERSGRWGIAAVGVPLAIVAGWFASGMPGMDHTSAEHDMASMTSPAPVATLGEMSPAEFASLDPSARVLNVHVPYEGEITGTDAFVDYRQIVGSPDVPSELDTPIALYCMSGRMSTIAGDALIAAGYTNVVHLAGGMKAWAADGRTLTTNS